MAFVDLNHLQKINHQFHGRSVLQRRFVRWFIGVVWKTNQIHDIFVECWDSGSDHCPLGLETWQWTLKGQPPPRQLPLQPRVSLSSHSLGTTHPGCPLCLSFSPSPSLVLSLSSPFSRFLSLQASFTRRFQELPVSPGWLKQTLTLFWYLIQLCSFSSHRPRSTQSIRCPRRHSPPPPWLFLDFKHSGTSQRVGKE